MFLSLLHLCITSELLKTTLQLDNVYAANDLWHMQIELKYTSEQLRSLRSARYFPDPNLLRNIRSQELSANEGSYKISTIINNRNEQIYANFCKKNCCTGPEIPQACLFNVNNTGKYKGGIVPNTQISRNLFLI